MFEVLFADMIFQYLLEVKKNNLVSGNAGDEKNLYPGGLKKFNFDEFN